MIVFLGKKYLTDKEAARIYGFSQSWFKKRRYAKKSPPYIKVRGKILYREDVLNQWFNNQIQEGEIIE